MAQMSVEQFANELGLLPAVLLEQLKAAGVKKMLVEDSLTEQDKAQLLDYLRKTHGATDTKSKVTLTRRQTSEIRKSDSTGRARTIQVEVRKEESCQNRLSPEKAKPSPQNRRLLKQRISQLISLLLMKRNWHCAMKRQESKLN